ncbi:MAG: alkaline phosphatase family protein [Gammaproteobacteria bacterium]|nr:MAG: alkaline phosphatase family protein [Gammaproteobacteria bacterium]
MKRRNFIASLLAALLMVPGFSAVASSGDDAPIVIVLSWDGIRHDYPDLGEFPALARVEAEGVRAERLTPVFPSSTFPTHVSMATGTYPDRHGIIDNVFLDAERGRFAYSGDASWIEAEPLWIASERQGVKTATYFWVGSESDWQGQGTSYRIAPFDSTRPESEKVDQILEWLSLPEAERPRLIMSYWAGADSVGHDDGPDSASVIAQIQAQDVQLGRLLDGIDALGLWPRTTLIMVGDHGMAPWTEVLNLNGSFEAAGIDAVAIGAAVVQVYLRSEVPDAEMRAALEDILADIPGVEFHEGDALPERYRLQRHNRLGDWVIILPPPFGSSRSTGTELWLMQAASWLGKTFGMHGYDPNLPDMGALFLAMGRDVPDEPLGEVRQIDLPATVARLLNIEPPRDSEGAPIW